MAGRRRALLCLASFHFRFSRPTPQRVAPHERGDRRRNKYCVRAAGPQGFPGVWTAPPDGDAPPSSPRGGATAAPCLLTLRVLGEVVSYITYICVTLHYNIFRVTHSRCACSARSAFLSRWRCEDVALAYTDL